MEALTLGRLGDLLPIEITDRDPRGIIWINEPPQPKLDLFHGNRPFQRHYRLVTGTPLS